MVIDCEVELGNRYLTPELIKMVVSQFRLPISGVHGPSHWMRVRKNGLMLAEKTGANTNVIELFALFHDSCRVTDDRDNEHGYRGGELAQRFFNAGALACDEAELAVLKEACRGHTGGVSPQNPTIATCWDADRLDLPRVFVSVNPLLMCTEFGKNPELINQAAMRAQRWAYGRRRCTLKCHDEWVVSKPRKIGPL